MTTTEKKAKSKIFQETKTESKQNELMDMQWKKEGAPYQKISSKKQKTIGPEEQYKGEKKELKIDQILGISNPHDIKSNFAKK